MYKKLILIVFLSVYFTQIYAMHNKEDQIGKEVKCINPVPCKKVTNNSYVLIKRESGKLILGYVAAIYNGQYYVKDTPNSGQPYKISDLYCEKNNSFI